MEAILILGLVTLQRLGELVLSNRNTARLMAEGAREVGEEHYPFMVALHAAWLAGLWWLASPWGGMGELPVSLALLIVYVLLQVLRFWVIATLGRRWTTRIIVLPDAPLVRAGPYRFLSHPNYVVVVGEIAVLPLMFGLGWYALLFSGLNALVLFVRIRAENAALGIGSRQQVRT
jgi:methyltransferase